ncbi:unnamed protein product [Spirodela intermedia]|uniref:Uncharacterized protein n=1 Tax=Spirodela intermedia TaxID=51605 RepID=A0A7I8KDZ3_SPIIN|nr:unnamed protein product [Spirodela intermedia]
MGDGEVWRWAALATAVLIQAAAGTNFNFPAYSTSLKAALGASQVGLNGLALASDLGKVLGWSAGVAALRLPLPAVVAVAAGMGLLGYGLQWLLVARHLPLQYSSVFILCLMAGCSICWFNTVCFALCTRAFPSPRHRSLALSLSVSFNGASAGFYALLATALPGHHPSGSSYLLLSATIPLLASAVALPPALRFSSPGTVAADHGRNDDESEDGVFLLLLGFAVLAGVHLLLLPPSSGAAPATRLLLGGGSLLLLLPLLRVWRRGGRTRNCPEDLELLRKLLSAKAEGSPRGRHWLAGGGVGGRRWLGRGRLSAVGEEHGPRRLVSRVDFWVYYLAYLCGGTVGLVYSNNLGQIRESQGRGGESTAALVGLYSSCSFFGRLLASVPDLLAGNGIARTGWLAAGLAPMPAAFFLLAGWGNCGGMLPFCTAAVALSSGFVFAAAVAVTAELFGAESVGVNHNILVTNIPLGSLIYGLLAALLYDTGAGSTGCRGRRCYAATFWLWGCITTVGVCFSAALFLRTWAAYTIPFPPPRPPKEGIALLSSNNEQGRPLHRLQCS